MVRLSCSFASVLALMALSSTALADEEEGTYGKGSWPLAATERPLTLGKSMLEIRGDTFGVNMSKDNVGKPLFLAPDIFFGVSDKLTVGISHITGICLSSAEDGCPEKYNDLALEAQYALMQAGNLQFAAHGGLVFPQFSPELIGGLEVGMQGRIRGGKVAIVFDPSLYLGALGRDEVSFSLVGPKETLRFPVDLQYQVNFQTMAFISTGLNGPLDGFGDAYSVPLGIGATFAINNRMDLGAELEFLNALGKESTAVGAAEKFDQRLLYARFALRL